jgi:hypothetical protein
MPVFVRLQHRITSREKDGEDDHNDIPESYDYIPKPEILHHLKGSIIKELKRTKMNDHGCS